MPLTAPRLPSRVLSIRRNNPSVWDVATFDHLPQRLQTTMRSAKKVFLVGMSEVSESFRRGGAPMGEEGYGEGL